MCLNTAVLATTRRHGETSAEASPTATLTLLTRYCVKLLSLPVHSVERYSSAVDKFSMRLAIKKELVLDEAENAIRECIAAFEKKPVELDAEWQRKVARARAELSVRKYKEEQAAKAAPKGHVAGTLNANNPADAVEMARMLTSARGRSDWLYGRIYFERET